MSHYVLRIGGVAYDRPDRAIARTRLEHATLWDYDGGPLDLVFTVRKADPTDRPGHKGKTVELLVDGQVIWSGDVRAAAWRDDRDLYTIEYTCRHLKHRADRVPVTDSLTRTDTVTFNMDPGPGYVPSRDGVSVGEALLRTLEMPENRDPLDARGIGRSVPGSGATASCTLVGSGVGNLTVENPGRGYDPGQPPRLVFVGGDPARRATGSVSVAADGTVSGLTLDDAGDYPGGVAPRAVITSYPEATAIELLEQFSLVPSHPITISGERLLDALDAALKADYPTAALHVEPDGTLRFLDLFDLAHEPTRAVAGDPGKGTVLRPVVDPATGEVLRIDVVHPGRGHEAPPEILVTGTGSGATATATLDADGGVASVAVTDGGQMYRPDVAIRTLAPLHPYSRFHPTESVEDCYGQVVYRGRPMVRAVWLSWAAGEIVESFAHSGLSNDEAKARWRSSDYIDPYAISGRPAGTIDLGDGTTIPSDQVADVTITNPGYGLEPNATYPLRFDPPATSGTTATGTFTTNADGEADAVTITNRGSGYDGTEGVTFAPPATASRDFGSVVGPNTTESLTLQSSDDLLELPADHWAADARAGVIHLKKVVDDGDGGQTTALTSRRVVTSEPLTAGGTYVVTVDAPLPITSYTDYEIVGSRGGPQKVWTEYDVTVEAIRNAITTEPFSVPQEVTATAGTSALLRATPYAEVWYDPDGDGQYQVGPIGFTVDPDAGKILFDTPVVSLFGNPDDLAAGGFPLASGTPTEIRVLVGYYDGTMSVTAPADGSFTGTAHDRYGLQETLTIQDDDWADPAFTADAQKRAEAFLRSVQDEVIEGELTHWGLNAALLRHGLAVEVGGYSYALGSDVTTGWESDALPVRRCRLVRTDGPDVFHIEMSLSNRFASYTGNDDMPPPRTGLQIGLVDTSGALFVPAQGPNPDALV